MTTYAYLQDRWGELRTDSYLWFQGDRWKQFLWTRREKKGGGGGKTKKKRKQKTEMRYHTEAVKLLSEYTADSNHTWALYMAQEPCELIVRQLQKKTNRNHHRPWATRESTSKITRTSCAGNAEMVSTCYLKKTQGTQMPIKWPYKGQAICIH